MTFRYAWKRSIPVMAGYIVLGMGFGMLLGAKGYGVFWAIAMSVFIYAGSMQYVAIDLITGGASLISAALMTLMVMRGIYSTGSPWWNGTKIRNRISRI